MRLVVHVGPHKTASTSLQHFLFNRRYELAGKGVGYPVIRPDLPSRIHHNDLALAMVSGNVEAIERDFDTIAQGACNFSTVVLSAEEFSSCVNTQMATGLRLLEARFGKPCYVFVDRDDLSRFTSSTTHNIADSFERVLAHGSIAGYLKSLKEFARLQRRFYEERGAEFIDFNSLTRGGVGRTFVGRVLSIEVEADDAQQNVSDNYTAKILAFDSDSVERLSKFIGDDAITRIVESGERNHGARKEVYAAIRRAIAPHV